MITLATMNAVAVDRSCGLMCLKGFIRTCSVTWPRPLRARCAEEAERCHESDAQEQAGPTIPRGMKTAATGEPEATVEKRRRNEREFC